MPQLKPTMSAAVLRLAYSDRGAVPRVARKPKASATTQPDTFDEKLRQLAAVKPKMAKTVASLLDGFIRLYADEAL